MADIVDMVVDFSEIEVSHRLRQIRKAKARVPSKVQVTECINCFEQSSTIFCSDECRQDFEYRKARQQA